MADGKMTGGFGPIKSPKESESKDGIYTGGSSPTKGK